VHLNFWGFEVGLFFIVGLCFGFYLVVVVVDSVFQNGCGCPCWFNPNRSFRKAKFFYRLETSRGVISEVE
jgi:hypothetical protein